MLIAVAILRARELSIRQHIMLLTVNVIELYIFHASFRVDGESISVLTYYVNRFLKNIFLVFQKTLKVNGLEHCEAHKEHVHLLFVM